MLTPSLHTLDRVHSANFGADLVVVGIGYGIVPTETVLNGTAWPTDARLSSDGRHWSSEWHSGPQTGDDVYVERHDATGCVFHGWVDSISRKIVQTG